MSNFISLYDYLGKAAGNALGKQVSEKAIELGIKHKIRNVETKTYVGPVMLYPKAFLELYFKAYNDESTDIIELNTQLMEDSFEQAEKRIY